MISARIESPTRTICLSCVEFRAHTSGTLDVSLLTRLVAAVRGRHESRASARPIEKIPIIDYSVRLSRDNRGARAVMANGSVRPDDRRFWRSKRPFDGRGRGAPKRPNKPKTRRKPGESEGSEE